MRSTIYADFITNNKSMILLAYLGSNKLGMDHAESIRVQLWL